jgi:hypothetical protein
MDKFLRELRNQIHSGIKLTNSVTVNPLVFADDTAILETNEGNMRESVFIIRKLRNVYKFKISTTNTIVMGFEKIPIFFSKI